jgi:hypothetical protein
VRSARPGALACALAAALAAAAGCVDVDGELGADGSLTLRYTYDPPRHATFASERVRLASPHVRVDGLEPGQTIDGYPPGEFVTASLVVDDATKLDTAPAFAGVRMTVALGTRRPGLSVPGLDPEARARAAAAPEGTDRRALRLSLVLPGIPTGPEPAATIEGRRVTWTLTIREFAAAGDTVTFATSWAAPADGDAAHSM